MSAVVEREPSAVSPRGRDVRAPAPRRGDPPAHWRVLRFKHVCRIREGQVSPEDQRYAELPLIAPNHIEAGSGRLLALESAFDQGASSGKYLVRAGELVYSKIRPALNKLCIAPVDALCSADMYPIECSPLLATAFLRYYMLGDRFVRLVVDESMRVAMPKVNRDTLANVPVLVPPMLEQRAIVTFLDRETAKLDALIAKKEQLLELLAEQRMALIDAGVSRSGGKLVQLRHVCSLLRDGTHQPPTRVLDGFPLLSVRNMVAGGFVRLSDDSMVSPEDFNALRRALPVAPGDVLLAIVGATLGKVAVVPQMDPFALQRSVAVLRPRPNMMRPEFLALILRTTQVQQQLWASVGFSAQPGIYLGALASMQVPVPQLAEQELTIAKLQDSLDRLERLHRLCQTAVDRLREYRAALITAAVTGQLDVRGRVPELEPAA